MPSLDEVKKQVAAYSHRYIFWTKKEIRALPNILEASEHVLALTSGFMNGATWLLVLTERRVIFLNCGMIFGVRQVQVALERIQSIDHSFTICFGNITVWDGASSYTANMVLKSSILPFVRATEEAIQRLKAPRPAAAPAVDIASQLERLAALREKGVLTEEEFQGQKKKLLA